MISESSNVLSEPSIIVKIRAFAYPSEEGVVGIP